MHLRLIGRARSWKAWNDDGSFQLGPRGDAWIERPPNLETLKGDDRYQRPSIGRPEPNLYVASEIEGGRFRIAGGALTLKMSR